MENHPHLPTRSPGAQKAIAVVALIFGVLTIFSGGNVLFGPDSAQAWAGNYVDFVVWFNFVAGSFYILAAIGLWLGKRWALGLSALIAIATAVVAFGFAFAVLRGVPYEMRTVGALALRFAFWAVAAWVAIRSVRQQ